MVKTITKNDTHTYNVWEMADKNSNKNKNGHKLPVILGIIVKQYSKFL